MKGKWSIIGSGAVIGILSTVLVKLGNPANMGLCIACFINEDFILSAEK